MRNQRNWEERRAPPAVLRQLAVAGRRLRVARMGGACAVAMLCVGACTINPPVTYVTGQRVGAVLVDGGPAVNVATPDDGQARVAGTVALGAAVGFLGLFAGRPDAIFYVPGAVGQESARAACVTQHFERHPQLQAEIVGVVERDFSKQAIFEGFVSYLRERTRLEVVALDDGGGVALSHEAAMRQAQNRRVDVLFELSGPRIYVDFDYGADMCRVAPRVSLAFRVVDVADGKELQKGYLREKLYPPEPTGAETLSHWLAAPGALAGLIESGYRGAMPQVWYAHLPTR